MNRHELAFTAHDGDLKAGNATPGSTTPTTCSDAQYTQALNYFNSLRAPAIFTTGDNDWTDGDRPSNGGFSSLVHGDSHYFRIDKPFLDAKGRRLENFTRVETFGDHQENGTNDVNWLKVFVDARSREVFAYQPQIVPGNRTAVPAA
jgi:hypothetical protein